MTDLGKLTEEFWDLSEPDLFRAIFGGGSRLNQYIMPELKVVEKYKIYNFAFGGILMYSSRFWR